MISVKERSTIVYDLIFNASSCLFCIIVFKMERVRIRSMLNNIKSYQPSLSARKHQDLNNRNCGAEINKNDDE